MRNIAYLVVAIALSGCASEKARESCKDANPAWYKECVAQQRRPQTCPPNDHRCEALVIISKLP